MHKCVGNVKVAKTRWKELQNRNCFVLTVVSYVHGSLVCVYAYLFVCVSLVCGCVCVFVFVCALACECMGVYVRMCVS